MTARLGASVANGVSGAVMLATGRRDGLRRVEGDEAGAARSFWAAAIAVPMLLCMRLIDWSANGLPAAPTYALARDLLTFAVGWAGFAVISYHLAGKLGRARRWPGYIAIWNWCNLVQYVLLLLASIPVLFHAPAPVTEAAELIMVGWALWLEWFATRLALEVEPLQAAAVVIIDLALGLLLAAFSGS